MPWNDNKGGKGPWGDGPKGSGGDDKSPWGRPGDNGQQGPDLEDSLKKMQEKFANRRKGGGGRGGKGSKGGGGFSGAGFAMFAVVGLIGWLATGVFQVNEQEQAVVLRFGEFHSTRGPGFHVRFPDPIETHEIVLVNEIQKLHIGTGASEGQMLTGDENIVDIDFVVHWKVNNPQDFLFNVNGPENTLKSIAESSMREVVGKMDFQSIISKGRDEVQTSTRELIQSTLDSYGAGIEITVVQLDKSQPPAVVNDAFLDVNNAAQDKVSTINQATAYANNVVPRARGEAEKILQEADAYRSKVIAAATGEAERFRLVFEEYRKAPRVTRERMYLETMEEVLGRSETIILDNDAGAVPYLPLDQLRRGEK
ncbi:FtsH protease activity modulator HflK [Hirschia baltica]|uniref:Protein HflK n=1 Tax=Hirschia baltica (strain ATCC 49814 / DSM 5838 / IFAM 1418) TaxID=582402 RepID=C6XMZ3_HIRBI|nr:FtsH protease activity modulator HflK [Hirschia baltica]ACT58163.1 HflK protein [Hirschia baltica ATCC 49814]